MHNKKLIRNTNRSHGTMIHETSNCGKTKSWSIILKGFQTSNFGVISEHWGGSEEVAGEALFP